MGNLPMPDRVSSYVDSVDRVLILGLENLRQVSALTTHALSELDSAEE
jgi:hypothetical protein